MTLGWGLIAATVVLTAAGCGLYLGGQAGWAQLLFVIASGTAGAGIVRVADHHRDRREP